MAVGCDHPDLPRIGENLEIHAVQVVPSLVERARNAHDLGNLVIQVADGRPVYLKDVATILDGPAEVESYSWIGFGPAAKNPYSAKDEEERDETHSSDPSTITQGELYPAVHIAVAKRKGSNAVWVADAVELLVAGEPREAMNQFNRKNAIEEG